jgi:hypothetical protein
MLAIADRALRSVVPKGLWKYRQIGQGYADYMLGREERDRWGGPFNGQEGRRLIFDAIISVQNPDVIVETGTFRGTTTEALADQGVPVVSIESYRRYYGFARARLRKFKNVDLRLGDSREVMRSMFDVPTRSPGRLFAYLDAHWDAQLPLKEELDIVFTRDPGAIVMIDDFHVPDDVGYGFDTYGPGAELTAEYIAPSVGKYGLAKLYPSLPSSKETGAKRGSVVLAATDLWAQKLLATGLLRYTSI